MCLPGPASPCKPRELGVSKVVLLPSSPGAPGSPGEKGAPGPGQPGPPGKMDSKGEPWNLSLDFFCSWSSYKAGFGSQKSEFWPRNENLHQLTLQSTWELQVELEDFHGSRTFAYYGSYCHLGEAAYYQLVLSKFLESPADE
ncbi:LOW QUALITY PROTEIN: ficolin-3 [Rhynchonycteris naso]